MEKGGYETFKRKTMEEKEFNLEKELLEQENAVLKDELKKLGLFSDSSFLPLQPDSEQEKTYSTEAVAPSSTLTSVTSSSTSYAELPGQRKAQPTSGAQERQSIQIGRTSPAIENAKRVALKADLYQTFHDLKHNDAEKEAEELDNAIQSLSEGTLSAEQVSEGLSTTPQRFYESGRQVEIGRFSMRKSATTVGQSLHPPDSTVSGSTISKKLNFESSEEESERGPNLPKCAAKLPTNSERKDRRWEERIIGEVAFQLDRRILQHIFCHRRRLYGFTVRNIEEKIEEIASDASGTHDQAKVRDMKIRKDAVMSLLISHAEFDPSYHPMFSELLVNKFGILKVNMSDTRRDLKDLQDIEYLTKILMDNIEPGYRKDTMVLLRSLNALAAWDKKPLLMW